MRRKRVGCAERWKCATFGGAFHDGFIYYLRKGSRRSDRVYPSKNFVFVAMLKPRVGLSLYFAI